MATKKTTTQSDEITVPENVTKALSSYKRKLTSFNLKEGIRYPANFEFKELAGKSKVDEIEFEINIDEYGSSPMILVNCYLDALFVGTFAFANKELVTDKYDKDAIKDKLDIPQNTRQYDIKLMTQKCIDNFNIKL